VGQFVGADAESTAGRNGIRIGDGYVMSACVDDGLQRLTKRCDADTTTTFSLAS
jgi:hypothetical protein